MAEAKNERALWIRGTLKARRADLGLSLRAATARINQHLPEAERITHQALDKWERFEVQPRVDQISSWCKGSRPDRGGDGAPGPGRPRHGPVAD